MKFTGSDPRKQIIFYSFSSRNVGGFGFFCLYRKLLLNKTITVNSNALPANTWNGTELLRQLSSWKISCPSFNYCAFFIYLMLLQNVGLGRIKTEPLRYVYAKLKCYSSHGPLLQDRGQDRLGLGWDFFSN